MANFFVKDQMIINILGFEGPTVCNKCWALLSQVPWTYVQKGVAVPVMLYLVFQCHKIWILCHRSVSQKILLLIIFQSFKTIWKALLAFRLYKSKQARFGLWAKFSNPSFEQSVVFFFFFKNYLYFWLRWVFVAACRTSVVVASWGYSSLQCAGFLLQRGGFFCCGAQARGRAGFSSCGTWAQ